MTARERRDTTSPSAAPIGTHGRAFGARPQRARRAFTLVEMMLALVLTGILTAAVGSVAVQSYQMVEGARTHAGEQFAWTTLRDTFEADVRGMIQHDGDGPTLVVCEDDTKLLRVLTLARIVDAQATFRQHLPATVQYEVEEEPSQPEHKRIVRIVSNLTEKETEPIRRVMATGLADVHMEYLIGKNWSDQRFESSRKTPLPQAIRLVCTWQNETIGKRSRTIVLGEASD